MIMMIKIILLKKDGEVIEESLDIIIWAISESEEENIKKFYLKGKKL